MSQSTDKTMYGSVPRTPDFPEMERRILAFWRETNAFDLLRQQNAGGERWSFIDGPITANNPMGVHHAWGRAYKDMFQRYHAMKGKVLRYQNGFDCQGLWVEVEVEKAHGFNTKNDITAYGIDNFVRDCKERVLTYAARQTEQSIRLGYWTDWDDPELLRELRDALHEGRESVTVTVPSGKQVTASPEEIIARLGSAEFGGSYFTFSTENNYTIWAFLKKCFEEGFIYRGTDVMPWCCRCGTGLSHQEVAEGRNITSHTSVFLRFPLRDREREALLVWTTTPWTLTSNVAAAVNPKATYLKVRHGEWIYYLGKDNLDHARVQNLEVSGKQETHRLHSLRTILKGSGALEILEELPGTELVGLTYHGPFDHLPVYSRPGGLNPYETTELTATAVDGHRVIPWDEVSGEEGTGIVHIAPGCGTEDHQLGAEHGLVAIAPLTDAGEYLEGFAEFSGRHVLTVADDVVTSLRERDLLLAREDYPHVYPHCWRCKEELVFRLVDGWFIRMDWRDRIQKVVPEIRWIPADGEAREQDWLKNMGDWLISKKRFWGLALPIWVCGDCGEFEVIGGEEELRARAVEGWESFEGHTPHRPWIDAVKLACPKCGGREERIADVGNPWLDAGVVPFSTLQYNSDREYWSKWYPAELVSESFPGQFRNWFYSLLAMAAMLDGRAPFRTLFSYGLMRDARGEEMHKSKGNSIEFDQAAEVLGAEVMRFLYAAQNPSRNLNFPDLGGNDKSSIDGEVRRKLSTLWNCYSFFVTYASVDDWRPGKNPIPVAERPELDRWILSRLQHLVGSANRHFEDYSLYRFMERLEQFDEELSNWYLRRSRRRFWKQETDRDKEAAYQTLYEVLVTEVTVLAPILPFLAEELYQNLVRSVDGDAPVSVHLTQYPDVDESLVDEALEERVDCVIRTKNLALHLRSQSKVKVRQPLRTLIVRPRNARDRETLAQEHFARQVLDECNVKELQLIADENELVTAKVRPNLKAIGPRYGKQVRAIGEHLENCDAAAVRDALQSSGQYAFDLDGTAVELTEGDLTWQLDAPDHLVVLIEQGVFAAIDKTLTPELEREGIARDFNRQAQDGRKKLDLNVTDRISVQFAASDRIANAVRQHSEYLSEELLAEAIERVATLDDVEEVNVSGEKVALRIRRVR